MSSETSNAAKRGDLSELLRNAPTFIHCELHGYGDPEGFPCPQCHPNHPQKHEPWVRVRMSLRDYFRSRAWYMKANKEAGIEIQNLKAIADDYRVASEANKKSFQLERAEKKAMGMELANLQRLYADGAASVETWKALAEKWEKQSAQNLLEWHKEKRSNAALHGVITRMKNGGKNGR